MTYVAVTFLMLAFLNIYTSSISKRLIYQSKEHSLVEKCRLTADELSILDTLNTETVTGALNEMESLQATRVIVTDLAGNALYDSVGSALGSRILLSEVLQALDGDDIFYGEYKKGVIICRSATPVSRNERVVGSVYMTEYDATQGILIRNLQRNVLYISFVLELFVLLFSFLFSGSFSRRIGRIMNSVRIIQEGDYSHKVAIGGRDELTLLGEEMNYLTDRLQISEEKRTRFVSDASHEIRTPLASIKLLADSILQNDMDPDTLREFVSDIGNEAERLNRMTAKMLALTQIDSEIRLETEITDMRPTIERVHRVLIPTAREANVSIHMELRDPCPVLILEDDLYQVVFNLMENGIKYNIPGGKLTVRLQQQEDNAVLTVEDTGIGIAEESIAHIFERFYRVDKSRSRATGGSGLGLAIVRTIVQNNRGEITASSNPGSGSCFTVTFPLFDMEADT